MSVLALCNKQATLMRHSVAQGGSGGQNPNRFWDDPHAICVPCSIQPASANAVILWAQKNMEISHMLYFADDYSANVEDKWVACDGRQFVVKGWYNSLDLDDSWVCPCYEVAQPRQQQESL